MAGQTVRPFLFAAREIDGFVRACSATAMVKDEIQGVWRVRMLRIAVLSLTVTAFLVAGLYGLRSYRTFLLLQSAQELGVPEASAIRGWMTLDYLSEVYGADDNSLRMALGLGEGVAGTMTLKAIAADRGVDVFGLVEDAQRAVTSLAPRTVVKSPEEDAGWLADFADQAMSGILLYGYPVLLAVVFFGSLGAPVPAGPAAAFAGSLAAAGQLDVSMAFPLALLGSLAGDVVAYGVGRAASPAWLSKWARWIGYTESNRRRADELFRRWGATTVVLAMSVLSQISSVTGLLAGLSRWNPFKFALSAAVGRLLWTTGYFGLGYVAGANFGAASGFLSNLGLFVLFTLAALTGGWFVLPRLVRPDAAVS